MESTVRFFCRAVFFLRFSTQNIQHIKNAKINLKERKMEVTIWILEQKKDTTMILISAIYSS